MEELHTLQISELMDLLSKHTDHFTKMVGGESSNEDYQKCRMTIQAIQAEIESRKNNESTNMTTPPDFIV